MTVNKRLADLVDRYSNGVVSQFAKHIGVSHTSIASMLPGGRESKPGFEIIAKITEAFPEINTDWLISGKGEMLRGGVNFSNNKQGKGNSMVGGNQTVGAVPDEDCQQQLAEARKEIEKWRGKYITLLEESIKKS